MNDLIPSLRSQWNALRLELLIPAKLRDEDFAAVLAARANPADRAFVESLPLTAARFKDDAQEYITGNKDALIRATLAPYDGTTTEAQYARLYKQDVNKINRVLFDAGTFIWPASTEIRIYRNSRVSTLHYDNADGHIDYAATYVARLGALPCLCISGKEELNASKIIRTLIDAAQKGEDEHYQMAEQARRELCARKILAPVPLGDVALLLSSDKYPREAGTLHCSSPVPPGEAIFSAFFRVSGYIRPQNGL